MTAEKILIKYGIDSGYAKYTPEQGYVRLADIIREYAKHCCELQRQICADKIVQEAELNYGSSIPDCWSLDSILNAPEPEI